MIKVISAFRKSFIVKDPKKIKYYKNLANNSFNGIFIKVVEIDTKKAKGPARSEDNKKTEEQG